MNSKKQSMFKSYKLLYISLFRKFCTSFFRKFRAPQTVGPDNHVGPYAHAWEPNNRQVNEIGKVEKLSVISEPL